MSFLTIIGVVILGAIILVIIFIGFRTLVMSVVSGIAYKMRLKHRQDDWETLKNKSWAELSEEEKRKLIIANDVGVVITEIQIEKMLEEQLPITEPNVGLRYNVEYK